MDRVGCSSAAGPAAAAAAAAVVVAAAAAVVVAAAAVDDDAAAGVGVAAAAGSVDSFPRSQTEEHLGMSRERPTPDSVGSMGSRPGFQNDYR